MSESDRLLFVGNGCYANRGCEAIAKSSIRIIRKHFPDISIYNGSEVGVYDQQDETEPDVTHISCPCYSMDRRTRFATLLYHKTGIRFDPTHASQVVKQYTPLCRAVLSMGGDLYGLSHSREVLMQYILAGEAAMKTGKPFIVWCATIGNMDTDPKMKKLAMEHFRRCTLILVRDQTSFNYLNSNGISDNVRLVADPAFTLEPAQPHIPLPNHEPLEEMIGFNLASAYGQIGKLGSYRNMIQLGADCVETIERKTGRRVMLVPHVVSFPETTYGNDTLFLSLVRECLAERGSDVPLLPSSLRSWEIKWVLGRMYAYVGSRWHSTVGALSSGTPTVSIGFSEKAPALNELLLGHARFVIDCRELTPGRLGDVVSSLIHEHTATEQALQERLPMIKSMSESAGDHLASQIGK